MPRFSGRFLALPVTLLVVSLTAPGPRNPEGSPPPEVGTPPPARPSPEVGPPPDTAGPGEGRNPLREPDPEVQELREALMGILTSTGNRTGHWAVLAVSLDRGDTLLELNARELMVPASNAKLLTTSAALSLLGPEFRLNTYLLAEGSLEGGVLDGNLIVYGTGDPTLSERFYPSESAPLDSLVARLAETGVEEIRGDLVVDGSFFQGPELHPDWDPRDLNDEFAAPVAALSFNENLITLRVAPGSRVGALPGISTLPEEGGIPVANLARTGPARSPSRIYLRRDVPLDPIGIEGDIPLGGREVWRRLPVADPLLFAGLQLRRALEARGVRLLGTVRTIRDPLQSPLTPSSDGSGIRPHPTLRILAVRPSPPLLDILRVVNKESHNLFAETVLRILGRVVLGDGSFQGGARVVRRFLTNEVGVPGNEIRVRDGSGLSTLNGISAAGLVRLLAFMNASPQWESLWSTLPEAGVRRELNRMATSPAARNLRAKTGTLDGVSALSGMVRTRSGERILFSILSNDVASEFRAMRAEDQLGIRLASLHRPSPN